LILLLLELCSHSTEFSQVGYKI